MTIHFNQPVACAVCGQTSSHSVLVSTNAIGAVDLDLRPPPMQRHTMSEWIQRCPGCGYVASTLDELVPAAAVTVASQTYQDKLAADGLPELARDFTCQAHLLSGGGDAELLVHAGWAMLHAAWVCDDACDELGARRCREGCLELLNQALQAGQPAVPGAGGTRVVQADVARRAGRLDEALGYARAGQAEGAEGRILALLDTQVRLCKAGDQGRHSMDELPGLSSEM